MKIQMEIDLTPEEFKQLMGWPEVGLMQQTSSNQASNDTSAAMEEQVCEAMKQSVSHMTEMQSLFGKAFAAAIKDIGRDPTKDP